MNYCGHSGRYNEIINSGEITEILTEGAEKLVVWLIRNSKKWKEKCGITIGEKLRSYAALDIEKTAEAVSSNS